ncbi:MAG: hypothetical protein P1V18_01915 [Candidatus Gracilibacteria bacterium]|nr:hypothetical protein [Candidatus Gracilibacteria bacterium]
MVDKSEISGLESVDKKDVPEVQTPKLNDIVGEVRENIERLRGMTYEKQMNPEESLVNIKRIILAGCKDGVFNTGEKSLWGHINEFLPGGTYGKNRTYLDASHRFSAILYEGLKNAGYVGVGVRGNTFPRYLKTPGFDEKNFKADPDKLGAVFEKILTNDEVVGLFEVMAASNPNENPEVIERIRSTPEGEHQALAVQMIEAGESNWVVDHFLDFKNIDPRVIADAMIKADDGLIPLLSLGEKYLPGIKLGNSEAMRLVEKGSVPTFMDYPDSFSWEEFDYNTVLAWVKASNRWEDKTHQIPITENIDRFSITDQEKSEILKML